MSLFCPLAKCKEQKGPCSCEKLIGAIVAVVVVFGLYHHFVMGIAMAP